MISPEREQYIRQLLIAGVSQREVARKAAVSRGTVQAIAAGRRRARKSVRLVDGRHAYEPEAPERWSWCKVCRRVVRQPCLKCFLLAIRRRIGGKR